MDDILKSKLSRRSLIARALVMPAVAGVAIQPGAMTALPDPLVAKAAAWVAANTLIDALSAEVDELEGKLFEKLKALRMKASKGARSLARGGAEDGEDNDLLVTKAEAWSAQRQCLDAMTRDWQQLETQIFARARRLNVAIGDARGRRFPEVQMMQRLDREMAGAHGRLAALAEEACLAPAIGIEGALIKITFGLRVQGRYGWQPHALELLEGGAAALRERLQAGS